MVASGNVGLAFGLVFGAGLCTSLGASLVLLTKLADHRMLSASLGLSAGVMIYVSIVEIFTTKAVESFEGAGFTGAEAYRYATICFFGGMILTWILEGGTIVLLKMRNQGKLKDRANVAEDVETGKESNNLRPHDNTDDDILDTLVPEQSERSCRIPEGLHRTVKDCTVCSDAGKHVSVGVPVGKDKTTTIIMDDDHQLLINMGLLSALAVGIHNFPEGLATFVGALANLKAGIAIAVAIALHNIPEGIVVAMPVYYATGSKWKAFLWASIPGLAEPVGGLIAYLVLHGDRDTPLTYGILFGLVAGMMVFISIKELIPTALKYDKEDKFVTTCCFIGMAIMAGSLLLFRL